MNALRIFISSPGDVGEERSLAERVITRLQAEFGARITLDPIFWEHEPLRATASFQEQIPHPSQTDIAIFILWSRLGTRLPEHIHRPDGSSYQSGTEYEFEDAYNGYQRLGKPDLLVYHKTAKQMMLLDEDAVKRTDQYNRLQMFINRHFHDADGALSAALHEFDTPARFEDLLDKHLRKLIQSRLPRATPEAKVPSESPLWRGESPFRGLAPFDYKHALIFCGRTRAISDVLNALRRQSAEGRPFVLILGMSGCGKSSLVRGGVLPRLSRPGVIEGVGLWRRAVFRPGEAFGGLFDSLAVSLLHDQSLPELSAAGTRVQELAQLLQKTPQAVVPLIRTGLSQAGQEVQRHERLPDPPVARLVLVVDQMEEIFTLPQVTSTQRHCFIKALAALVNSGHVWALATLRSDFYPYCEELPELLYLKEGAGQYDLQPPTPAEISQMIRQPARMAGLWFEEHAETGERLDDVLRDAGVEDPGALPLLEFALDELYRRRTAEGLLSHAAYEAIGRLEGALAKRAEEVFTELPENIQKALPSVVNNIIGLDLVQEERIVRKHALLETVTAVPENKALVGALVDARLFITDRTDDGTTVVSVAHEALLYQWPRIQGWLSENRDFLRTRARLGAAEILWQEQQRDPGFLLPAGQPLAEAEHLLTNRRTDLSAREVVYIETSRTQAKKQHRRRIGMRGLAALILLIAAGIGLWSWDAYYRPHIEYYRSFIKRWGSPEGVGPLTHDQAKNRAASAKLLFKGRRGAVQEVSIVNSSGNPPLLMVGSMIALTGGEYISQEPIFSPNKPRPVRYIFERSETGRVIGEKVYDVQGRLMYELRYSSENVASFVDSGTGYVSARFGSGVTSVRFIRYKSGEKAGLEREIRFTNQLGDPKPDAIGTYGTRFFWKRQPRRWRGFHTYIPIRFEHIDAQGEPMVEKNGVVATTLKYTSDGEVKELALFGMRGQPVVSREFGLHRILLILNVHGNVVGTESYDTNGNLTINYRGFARLEHKYDQHGNPTGEAYFGVDGELTLNKDLFAQAVVQYDEHGNLISVAYSGKNGEPKVTKDGIARATVAHDEHGNRIAEVYLGVDGKPTLNKNGVAGFTRQFDNRGNITSEAYIGLDDKPILNINGFARVTRQYDEQHNIISEAYLGVNGKPTLHKEGFARIKRQWDERGNLIAEAYLGIDDKPVLNKNGIARVDYRYDEHSNLVAIVYSGVNGEPTPNRYGIAQGTIAYDERGNRISEAYFVVDGRPTLNKDGVARYTRKYDERGNLTSEAYFGVDDKPTLNEYGIAKIGHQYDVHGNLTVVEYSGVNGEATLHRSGVARRTAAYDERGNRIAEAYFGVDGRPTRNKDGVARYTRHYDERGNLITEACFGLDGKPILQKFGFSRVTGAFDERGNRVAEAFYGVDGKPALHRDGFARVTYNYDERGNRVAEAYFGLDDKPTLVRNEFSRITRQYDARGNMISVAYFATDGSPILSSETGVSKIIDRYDDRNNSIETTYFGLNGEPTVDRQGVARVTRQFDQRDNLLVVAYFGLGGEPVTLPEGGVSKIIYRYDERDKPIEMINFDKDGKSTVDAHGVARITRQYDDRGNRIREAYFGLNGRPAVKQDVSIASLSSKYNIRNKLVEKTYFDKEGKPTRHIEGYARIHWIYDNYGREIERVYFDEDGGPVVTTLEKLREKAVPLNLKPVDRMPVNYALGYTGGYIERLRTSIMRTTGGLAAESEFFSFTKTVSKYNASDTLVRQTFLNQKGEAAITIHYDELGNFSELKLLFEDPLAIKYAAGYAKILLTNKKRGNQGKIIERRFLDQKGKPTLNNRGMAGIRETFDRGKLIDLAYFDLDDRRLSSRVHIGKIRPGSQADKVGLVPGDIIFKYEGQEIETAAKLINLLRRKTEGIAELQVLRGNEILNFQVTPGRLGVMLQDRVSPESH